MFRSDALIQCLLAALCVMSQAVALGHHVLVAHTHCAEHGALVHAASGHAGHTAHESSSPDAHTGAAVDGAGAAHLEAHDHCNAATDHKHAVVAVASAVLSDAPVAALVGVWFAQTLTNGRALHRLAPKTSPPV